MKLKELGTLLREERLKQGLSLDHIKEKTKLSEYVLQAIENGDAAKLPVEVYAKSFIKSYIKELGLDSPEIIEELNELFPAASQEFSSVEFRSVMTPLPSIVRSLKLILIVFFVFSLLGLGLWFGVSFVKDRWQKNQDVEVSGVQEKASGDEFAFWEGQKEKFGEPDIIENDPRPEPKREGQSSPTVQEKKEKKQTEKEVSKPAKREKDVSSSGAETAEKVTARQEEAGVAQVPAQVPKESGAGPEKTQVFKVTATDGECWVGAEIDGSVLERYLYPGQSTSFSFGQKLQLKVGNATVVQASLNGKPYKIVGQGPVRVIEILAEEQLGQ